MFTIHISDVKATLWIFDRLLVLYLNCKSVMNFVPINFYLVFFTSPDKQKFKENRFSYTLYYIYWNKAVEDLHAEWVCISDDGFLEVLYKLEIFITYLVHLVVFCHFYMFVLNKLFYSECIRWRQCVLIDYMCSLVHILLISTLLGPTPSFLVHTHKCFNIHKQITYLSPVELILEYKSCE